MSFDDKLLYLWGDDKQFIHSDTPLVSRLTARFTTFPFIESDFLFLLEVFLCAREELARILMLDVVAKATVIANASYESVCDNKF